MRGADAAEVRRDVAVAAVNSAIQRSVAIAARQIVSERW